MYTKSNVTIIQYAFTAEKTFIKFASLPGKASFTMLTEVLSTKARSCFLAIRTSLIHGRQFQETMRATLYFFLKIFLVVLIVQKAFSIRLYLNLVAHLFSR